MLVVLGLLLLAAGYVCSQQIYPYISFRGQTLANHSYVDLSRVGDDFSGNDSVQCITDLYSCCSASQGSHRGDWYFPDRSRLQFDCNGSSHCFYERRMAQRVDLYRFGGGPSGPSGIYRCNISTIDVHSNSNYSLGEMIFVGLYTAEGGDIKIVGSMEYNEISDINGPNPQFTLTCISTGGPATNVTWTRELYEDNRDHPATILTEGHKTVLVNASTSLYTHTLTVTGRIAGFYTCIVSNNKPSEAFASSCLFVEALPSVHESFQAVVANNSQVVFTWSKPTQPIANFTIFCSPSPATLPLSVSPESIPLIVTGFSVNTPYSCSLVANNCRGSGPPATLFFTTQYNYFELLLKGIALCSNFTESDREKKLKDVKSSILQELIESGCSEYNSYVLDNSSFSCHEEYPDVVTYRARFWETSKRDSSSLISLIEDWVRDGASVIVTGVLMTVDSDCPVAISSLSDPQCTPVSSPLPSIAPSADTSSTVVGLVVVIVVLLIVAGVSLTVLIVYTLRTKNALSQYEKKESERKRKSLELSTNVAYKNEEVTRPQEDYETIETVDTTDTGMIPANTSSKSQMNPSLPPRSPVTRYTPNPNTPTNTKNKTSAKPCSEDDTTTPHDPYNVTTPTEDTAYEVTMTTTKDNEAYEVTKIPPPPPFMAAIKQEEYEPV